MAVEVGPPWPLSPVAVEVDWPWRCGVLFSVKKIKLFERHNNIF
jgi:hypothetical protein